MEAVAASSQCQMQEVQRRMRAEQPTVPPDGEHHGQIRSAAWSEKTGRLRLDLTIEVYHDVNIISTVRAWLYATDKAFHELLAALGVEEILSTGTLVGLWVTVKTEQYDHAERGKQAAVRGFARADLPETDDHE